MFDGCDVNIVQQINPVVPVNPYSLPATHGLFNVEKQQLLADSNEVDEVLIKGDKVSAAKPDGGVSSSSSVDSSD